MDEHVSKNLQKELREALLPWTLIPWLVSGLALAIFDRGDAPLPSYSSLGMLNLVLVVLVWVVRRRDDKVAAWLMSLGSICIIWLAWRWFPSSDAHHALLYPIIVAAITLDRRACVTVATFASLILGIRMVSTTTAGLDSGPLLANAALVWGTTLLMCVSQHPQETMISWAWEGYAQARRNLEEARDRQAELKQALEDLALATSEAIRLNEMLSAARKAVEDARRAKEEFVANVSHELRTPLNMIIGFSEMILESPEVYSRRLPPPLMADVAAIKRNSEHLASLVDDVLDLAEAETGRMQLFREWTSIQEIAREAAEAVVALFEKKGLSLTVSVLEDLPPVYCDRTRVRQVILNLLSNAGRFTEVGGAEVRACIRDGMVVVSTSDTGPGMASEKLDRMFEPFHQEDQSIRRRYGGSGLGLAISKRFIEMHGGKIWLESEVGAGTTASFTLPMSIDGTPEDTPERWFSPYQEYTPRTRRSGAPKVAAKARVVVVEEGEAVSRLIPRYLENLEAIRVESLAEAGRAVESNAAVALVINELPRAAALEAASRVPVMSFDVPVISCWVPGRQEAFSKMGAQDYLVKPVSRSDLLESITRTAPHARSILLVDDDAEARQLFGRMLASADRDYVVLHAADGEAALSFLREREPDLLLLDLVMPDMDGFAVLEAKASDTRTRDIPVIVVSAKDPQREPIVSKSLTVTRMRGLSAHDLMLSLESLTQALKPRYGEPAEPGMIGASQACE